MAADGFGFFPAACRTLVRRASWMRSHVPSACHSRKSWNTMRYGGRSCGNARQTSTSTGQYYITSHAGTAKELGERVRSHWSIENSLHWVLDVVYGEDASRVRAGHAGENLALIRRVAVSLLVPASGMIPLVSWTL